MLYVYPDGSVGDPESDREALKEAIKILIKEKIKENNMPKMKLEIELDEYKAFELLLETLHVDLNEDIKEDAFAVDDGEILVKDYDDRGELYLALYHLATKIYPNTGFRSMFDDPRKLMTKLYKERDKEE